MVDKKIRKDLTEKEKWIIITLFFIAKWDLDRIRQVEELKRPNGKKITKDILERWIERYAIFNNVDKAKKSGRPSAETPEKKLEIKDTILANPKKSYAKVTNHMELKVDRRTVNNYALKMGISKLYILKTKLKY